MVIAGCRAELVVLVVVVEEVVVVVVWTPVLFFFPQALRVVFSTVFVSLIFSVFIYTNIFVFVFVDLPSRNN